MALKDLLVERYKQHGVLDVVLTLASAIEDEKASKVQVDHLILELLYLLYLRSTPDDVAAATDDPTRSAAKVCCVRVRAALGGATSGFCSCQLAVATHPSPPLACCAHGSRRRP